MSKSKWELVMGLLVVLVPMLGLPRDIKTAITITAGAIIVAVSLYSLRRETLEKRKLLPPSNSFTESRPAANTPPAGPDISTV